MNRIKNVTKKQLFLPVFSMILVMLINVFFDVMDGKPALDFFSISITNGVLFGRIIDILNRGSEIAILALGMTLVVSASAGTDISVGSVMSLAGGVCCTVIAGFGVTSVASAAECANPIWLGILCGIGAAVTAKDQVFFEELYKEADAALYEAKRNGKARFVLRYLGKEEKIS